MQSGRDHDAALDAQASAPGAELVGGSGCTTTIPIWVGPDPSSQKRPFGQRDVPWAHIEQSGGLAEFLKKFPRCKVYASQVGLQVKTVGGGGKYLVHNALESWPVGPRRRGKQVPPR